MGGPSHGGPPSWAPPPVSTTVSRFAANETIKRMLFPRHYERNADFVLHTEWLCACGFRGDVRKTKGGPIHGDEGPLPYRPGAPTRLIRQFHSSRAYSIILLAGITTTRTAIAAATAAREAAAAAAAATAEREHQEQAASASAAAAALGVIHPAPTFGLLSRRPGGRRPWWLEVTTPSLQRAPVALVAESMPLITPVGPINVFVDVFARRPFHGGGPSGGPPAWIRGFGPAFEGGGGPLDGTITVSPDPHSSGGGGALPGPTIRDGGASFELFGCKECVPALYVLTHAHTDHLRGLRGASWVNGPPQGPLLCTETTSRLLLKGHPYLKPFILPLALHTPYLFFVRRCEAGGPPPVKERHRGPYRDWQQQSSLQGAPSLEPLSTEGSEPKEKVLASGRDQCSSSSNSNSGSSSSNGRSSSNSKSGSSSSRGEEEGGSEACGLTPRLLVDRAAAAARSSSSRGRGFCCSCGCAVDGVYVHLVDARHCPGSALLLLRSPAFGCFVHTGDFCCSDLNLLPLLQQVQHGLHMLQQLDDPAAAAAAAAAAADSSARCLPDTGVISTALLTQKHRKEQQQQQQQQQQQIQQQQQQQIQLQVQQQQVDVLFLDNTYLHPSFVFLSRPQAIQVMCEHVRRACSKGAPSEDGPPGQGAPSRGFASRRVIGRGPLVGGPLHLHVIVGVEKLGKETLLQQLGQALGTRVRLSEAHYDFLAAAAAPAAAAAAAATAPAAAAAADSCMYTLDQFIRGFGCPFVEAATQMHTDHSNSSKDSNSGSSCCCSGMEGCEPTRLNGGDGGVALPSISHDHHNHLQQQQQQQEQQQQDQQQQQQGQQQQQQQQQREGGEPFFGGFSLFAVSRRSLQKAVGALEAQGLKALGLLPSGGCVESHLSGSVHAVSFSSHSSFPSLQLFVEALSPKKIVLLESLPIPCNACTTPAPDASSFNTGEGPPSLCRDGGFPLCAWGGDALGGPPSWGAPSGKEAPAALLLDDPVAVELFDDIKAEGLTCTDTSSHCSNGAAIEAGGHSACKGGSGGDWGWSSGVSSAFNYDGREGLAALLEATGVPEIILGSGRRVYCVGGPPHACGLKDPHQKRRRRFLLPSRHVFPAAKLKGGPPEPPEKVEEAGEAEVKLLVLPRKTVKRMGGLPSLRFVEGGGGGDVALEL
ncbi:hypothetical protein ACSSS7_000825 [Eimeria intestinalis]